MMHCYSLQNLNLGVPENYFVKLFKTINGSKNHQIFDYAHYISVENFPVLESAMKAYNLRPVIIFFKTNPNLPIYPVHTDPWSAAINLPIKNCKSSGITTFYEYDGEINTDRRNFINHVSNKEILKKAYDYTFTADDGPILFRGETPHSVQNSVEGTEERVMMSWSVLNHSWDEAVANFSRQCQLKPIAPLMVRDLNE